MIDVVHTKQGKSFKGLVTYLLEGSIGAENPERVAWTETRNLGTKRPKMAARVMAATAMNQHEIMRQAGVAVRKKSSNHVMHYTLSWPGDSAPSKEEMMRAVNGSLAVLGEKAGLKGGRKKKDGTVAKSREALRDQFASEHQVLVVAHEDTDKPHVHIVVNRVHPEHGVLLPTSHDFRRLSRWAQKYDYEFNKGDLAVPQRAINNERRDAGDRVYQKRIPRDAYELEKVANDNRPAAQVVQMEQRTADRNLAKKSAGKRAKWKQEWLTLEADYLKEKQYLWRSAAQKVELSRREAGETFGKKRAILFHEQAAAKAAFKRNENHIVGRAMNAIRTLLSLKAGVNVLWSQGARKEVFDRTLVAQKHEFEARVNRAREEAGAKEERIIKHSIFQLGITFRVDRAKYLIKHRRRLMALRSLWKERELERKQAWEEHLRAMGSLAPEKSFGAQMVEPDARTKKALLSDRLRNAREKRKRDRKEGRDDDRGR